MREHYYEWKKHSWAVVISSLKFSDTKVIFISNSKFCISIHKIFFCFVSELLFINGKKMYIESLCSWSATWQQTIPTKTHLNFGSMKRLKGSNPSRCIPFLYLFTQKSGLHLKGFDLPRLFVEPKLQWVYAGLTIVSVVCSNFFAKEKASKTTKELIRGNN